MSRPDKEALRAILESQVQEKLRIDPEAVTLYAARPELERKPYSSKPTVQGKAFANALDQIRLDVAAGTTHKTTHDSTAESSPSLSLDDYPDL